MPRGHSYRGARRARVRARVVSGLGKGRPKATPVQQDVRKKGRRAKGRHGPKDLGRSEDGVGGIADYLYSTRQSPSRSAADDTEAPHAAVAMMHGILRALSPRRTAASSTTPHGADVTSGDVPARRGEKAAFVRQSAPVIDVEASRLGEIELERSSHKVLLFLAAGVCGALGGYLIHASYAYATEHGAASLQYYSL